MGKAFLKRWHVNEDEKEEVKILRCESSWQEDSSCKGPWMGMSLAGLVEPVAFSSILPFLSCSLPVTASLVSVTYKIYIWVSPFCSQHHCPNTNHLDRGNHLTGFLLLLLYLSCPFPMEPWQNGLLTVHTLSFPLPAWRSSTPIVHKTAACLPGLTLSHSLLPSLAPLQVASFLFLECMKCSLLLGHFACCSLSPGAPLTPTSPVSPCMWLACSILWVSDQIFPPRRGFSQRT